METGRGDDHSGDGDRRGDPGGAMPTSGRDGQATRRVRIPLARPTSPATAPTGPTRPSPLVEALAAVIRDAMDRDGR